MALPARNLLLIVFLFGWPTMLPANIGEDLTQLRERYGSAKDVGGEMLFQVRFVDDKMVRLPPSADPEEGYSVTVYFDGDHSAMEIFTRNTSDSTKADISPQDIDLILAAESDGMAWNPVQSSSGKPTWIRADNKLIARFSANKTGKIDDASVLVIMQNTQ